MDLILPDGYTACIPWSKIKHNNDYDIQTCDILYNNEAIGAVSWHAYYYPTYQYKGKLYGFRIGDYIQGENPRQKCADMVIAMHKVIGQVDLNCLFTLHPNPTFLTYTLFFQHAKDLQQARVAEIVRFGDKWKVKCGADDSLSGVYDTIQESINKCTEVALKTIKTR